MAAASTVLAKAERRARRDPAFAAALTALVDAPTSSAGRYTAAAARELNRSRQAAAFDEFLAAALPTAEVQRRLALKTPQAVHRLRSRGRLLGVPRGNATWFPSWQLDGSRLRDDLPAVIERLRHLSDDVVAADRVMRLQRDELGGRSIADALDDRRRAAAAWALLDQLAA